MDKVIKWATVAPPITAGALGWAMLIALLPVDLAGVGFIAAAGIVLMLASSGGERYAVRVVTRARPAANSELGPLRPGAEIARQHGFSVRDLYVSPAASPEAAAPIGRRSIVVSPTLVARAYSGTLDPETVAVVLAHAEARRHAEGRSRLDIAGRLLGLPWIWMSAAVRRVSRAVRWLPGMRAFPVIAILVVATAEWRTASQGLWWLAALLAVSSTVALGTSMARRVWSDRVRVMADHELVVRGMGRPLMRLIEEAPGGNSAERLIRIQQAMEPHPMRLRLVNSTEADASADQKSARVTPERCFGAEPNRPRFAVLLMEVPRRMGSVGVPHHPTE